jgi:hypothetical protein
MTARAYLAADLPGDPRPADRAQRLVEDLGDDRLAHRLVDLAGQLIDKVRKLAVNCWSCVNAPSQFAGIAAIDGPQDAVDDHDGRPSTARRRLVTDLMNALPNVSRTPKGAFYAFPNIGDRLEGQEACLGAAGGNRRGADRRAGFRHRSARAISGSPSPIRRRISKRRSAVLGRSEGACLRIRVRFKG